MIGLNGNKLDIKIFPNGETLLDKQNVLDNLTGEEIITFKYENDSDLIQLMLVKNHLDSLMTKSHLIIMYMPYSRMDRSEGGSVFTLKYISKFINSLNFCTITVYEPHSDVTMALLDRSVAEYPSINLLDWVVGETRFNVDNDYIFFPDQGAAKRYSKIKGYKSLVGFKERDFQTGQIKKLELVGNVEKTGFKVIIVDDLCSYGGTFIMSAERLIEAGASEVYLLVGHCEKSIYKGKILETDLIKNVFTTDSILDTNNNHEKIKIYSLGGF